MPAPPPRPLRVLEAVRPPDGTTRYIDQVVAYAGEDVCFSYISVGEILRGRYDVVHFHWPEMLVRHRRPTVEFAKSALLQLWLVVLRWRGIAVVRTLHNLEPHEEQRAYVRRALKRLDDATQLSVAINSTTPMPTGGVLIPHGHYRSRFAEYAKCRSEKGRLLYAGILRPYKGVEELLDAFAALPDRELTLRVVGKPTAALREQVLDAVQRDPERVSAQLEFVPDADLVREITSAELICLPYREMHNSGMALVALSLDRPVLVPDTEATRALAEEVGPGWVHTFTGELTADHIARVLATLRAQPTSTAPRLGGRDWEIVGRSYVNAFRTARLRALN